MELVMAVLSRTCGFFDPDRVRIRLAIFGSKAAYRCMFALWSRFTVPLMLAEQPAKRIRVVVMGKNRCFIGLYYSQLRGLDNEEPSSAGNFSS
jgi:hypothetical protein